MTDFNAEKFGRVAQPCRQSHTSGVDFSTALIYLRREDTRAKKPWLKTYLGTLGARI